MRRAGRRCRRSSRPASPLRRVGAVEGAGRLFSTPSRPALRPATTRRSPGNRPHPARNGNDNHKAGAGQELPEQASPASHAPMRFFEPSARPTAEVARAKGVSPPGWIAPPHNVLPGIAPVQLIVARTDETVAAVAAIQAYPAGFSFTLSLRLRNPAVREEQRL